ncbi:Myb-like DNA-binding protein [Aspergillus sclerotiicarbonarius CBS 121057]|uniref:Myb-like DNA-binding protein n=1 Tax=Aspergillus sclerotiicarbonarius (strain CBS 121057 / IBT 28362) TaxID=1448318 RepID=A0A319DZ80_ASPSB|nr:Myb-like DNA-binding protein [Aspergillus sclerotiicarbonarius CBS 121057]
MARLAQSQEPSQSSTEPWNASKGKTWTGSPIRRRVTRSQSRELEGSRPQQHDDDGEASVGASRRRWRGLAKGRVGGEGLDVVVEESPLRSAQRPGQYANQVIPETPEEEANISGTTILPSEPDNDLDPDIMVEALPDVERAAANVLDFLVPGSADPVSIISTAKKLGDPASTHSRRLERSVTNLKHEAKYFGQTTPLDYLDVERIAKVSGLEDRWKPVLHKANCAFFALRVLLARPGAKSSPEQAISGIHGKFPLPLMTNLVENDVQKSVDESYLNKDTFELALEIRTQYIIMQLEAHQDDDDFDPVEILTSGFFLNLPKDAPEDAERRLRGFNLERFTGLRQELPSRYRSDVEDRYNDMRVVLEVDGTIEALKGDYRWQKFVMQAARWIRKRTDEINKDLKDTHDVYSRSKPRHSLGNTVGFSTPSSQRSENRLFTVESTTRRTATLSDAQGSSQPLIRATSVSSQRAATPAPAPDTHDVPDIIEPETTVPRVASVASDDLPPGNTRESTPEARDEVRDRRKSSRPSFLNKAAINRVMQRQQQLRGSTETSSAHRQSDFVRPNVSGTQQSASDRRQTVSAIPPRQSSVSAAAQETFDASRTLVNDDTHVNDDTELYEETELHDEAQGNDTEVYEENRLNDNSTAIDETEITVNDEPLDISQHTESHPERSHSPPMARSASRPRHVSTSTLAPPVANNLSLPSSRDVWNMAKAHTRPRLDTSRPAFIDRQENAVRVSPVSQASDTRSVERRPRGRPPKRRREASSSSDSDEFEADDREVDTERRRANKPVQTRRSKRARVDSGREETRDGAEDQRRQGSQGAAQSPARTQAGSPQRDNNRETASPAPKRKTGSGRGRQSRGWSEAEDARLVRLIEEHGVSWAKIENENLVQPEREGEARITDRNQVQLKDRARNLKIKFYREGLPIPKNFGGVTMKRGDCERLEKLGIDLSRER